MTTHRPDLDALYAPPSEMIQKAVTDRLLDFHVDYLRTATFFCFATGRTSGLDASPRGGQAGFVQVLDAKRIAFADWPGNNRIESMRNLEEDDRAALLFLFPGLEVFLRINGRAHSTVDPETLELLKEGRRIPKAGIVVDVEEVLFHCGKAINRARLWREDSKIDRQTLPSVGTILVALAEMRNADIAALDAHYDQSVRNELY